MSTHLFANQWNYKNFYKKGLQGFLLTVSALCIVSLFYFSKSDPKENVQEGSVFPQSQQPAHISLSALNQAPANVNNIVTDAIAFYNMLSASQQATLQLTYTTALARKWSNLPCGTSCRNGLQLGTNLTSAQYEAAMQIVKDALSNALNEGYDEFHQMNLAEAYLHVHGGNNGYDSTLRWMAFLNTPTATGSWMLQFGGHHYAANIAFNNGHVIGATPFFMGLEPKTFTYNTVTYDPLGQERDSLRAALAALTSAQLSTAYISSSFSDCVMIPGETNGGSSSFPAVAIGQSLSSLPAVQNLALAAIKLYVGDMDSATRVNVMAGYTSEISQTYISYHDNGTSGNPASFLTDQGDYVRISGPHVWIEFSCQGGIVISGQIHYHTVWRDRSHDYGNDLHGTPIDASNCSPTSFTATPVTACNAYTWNGVTYTTSGIKTWTGTNAAGCDSVVTLHLTINNSTSSTTTAAACSSYSWNGNTYTTSGIKTWTGTNAAGCDSTANLNLTINSTSSSTTSAVACASYTWNGTSYSISGTKSWIGTNAAGCDSIAYLNLIIQQPVNYDTSVTSTGSYTWVIDGVSHTYNQSGIYKDSTCGTKILRLTLTTNTVVYPNPTNGAFNINLAGINNNLTDDMVNSKNVRLTVYDAIGRKMLSQSLKTVYTDNHDISIKKFADGVYFIKIQSADESINYTTKIVKSN